MFKVVKRLQELGVLSINQRNADYLLRYNRRRFYPNVDDKILTKKLAAAAGVRVPETYAVVQFAGQVRKAVQKLKSQGEFVVKPARGSGGEGVLVITGIVEQSFRRSNGEILDEDALSHHMFNILSGMYSLGGLQDRALIEYRVRFDPLFEQVSFEGVPDIRIIVFWGVPVMAMARLPTRTSKGRANLHQGAIGAGIDIASGTTSRAIWKNKLVTSHPDTGAVLAGLKIPRWEELLHLASRSYDLTKIVYQGVDIVLDRDKGPMLLEMNARPGLAIQSANAVGLLHRLQLVENFVKDNDPAVEEKVAFAKTLAA